MSPPDVSAAYARVVARMNPPMVVVTVVAGDERSGCLVGFHSQCSIDPPRHAVWISIVNHSYAFVERAEVFAVHVLERDDHPLAELFGGATGDDVDKFARCRWTAGPGGVPLLEELPTRFVGRKVAVFAADGDHVCVVLEPIAAEVGPAAGQDASATARLADVDDIEPGHPA